MSAPDVVVVGGGLVGAACAYELAGAAVRVTLVDRHDAGRATDAGAGILSPQTMGRQRLRVSPGLGEATFVEVRAGLRPVSDDTATGFGNPAP